jgi:hypothetical protein
LTWFLEPVAKQIQWLAAKFCAYAKTGNCFCLNRESIVLNTELWNWAAQNKAASGPRRAADLEIPAVRRW